MFSVFIGEDFGFKMTVSSNKCKGKLPPVCMSEMIVLKLAQFNWNCIEFCRSVIHWIKSGVSRKGCFFFKSNFGNQKKIPLASCYWTESSKHPCDGADLCTIGNIYVSIALFGEGNVISIVLLKKMCRERIKLFFLFWVFFIIIIILESFLHYLWALCFQETENKISINKLE